MRLISIAGMLSVSQSLIFFETPHGLTFLNFKMRIAPLSFSSSFKADIYVLIPSLKYQVKPESSPWFTSMLCRYSPEEPPFYTSVTNRVIADAYSYL